MTAPAVASLQDSLERSSSRGVDHMIIRVLGRALPLARYGLARARDHANHCSRSRQFVLDNARDRATLMGGGRDAIAKGDATRTARGTDKSRAGSDASRRTRTALRSVSPARRYLTASSYSAREITRAFAREEGSRSIRLAMLRSGSVVTKSQR